MNIKKLVTLIAFITLFSMVQMKAQTVYVTDSGKKYHAKNCEVVKTGKKGIELAEAQKQGYEPCKVCKAPATKKQEADKPKEGKAKAKSGSK